jgi:hypothetical protein
VTSSLRIADDFFHFVPRDAVFGDVLVVFIIPDEVKVRHCDPTALATKISTVSA